MFHPNIGLQMEATVLHFTTFIVLNSCQPMLGQDTEITVYWSLISVPPTTKTSQQRASRG